MFVCHSAGDSNHSVIVWMEVEVVVVVKENSHKLLGQTLFRRNGKRIGRNAQVTFFTRNRKEEGNYRKSWCVLVMDKEWKEGNMGHE